MKHHMVPQKFETCVILGLGYIGLPTSVVVARSGVKVVGVDINAKIVAQVNAGECPIEEPGLPAALKELVSEGRIVARTAPTEGDVYIIAVPTPFTGGYKPDLSFVEAAARSIAPHLKAGNLVIVESTIPVGGTEQTARWLEVLRPDLTFSRRADWETGRTADVVVAHCPERVLPGQMLKELVENDRVIGGICPTSKAVCGDFYKSFVTGACHVTDARTAELCKLTENSYRDVNIAFANELAELCGDFDVNVWELVRLANKHPRVNILQPGPGVGGHCIAVDPWFIVSALGDKARLIREARWINSGRPRQIVKQILELLAKKPCRQIACLGLSYKANVGDLRESPAVEVVEYLAKEIQFLGAATEVLVVEPLVDVLPHDLQGLPCVRKVTTAVALRADMIVTLTDHTEFRKIPADQVQGKVVVDTRGIWQQG